ncbi:MAG: hypothetical protein LIP16_11575 [Clostridium sp.]|nr:hypothetical protein [Clostridium sp.]
MEYSLGGYGVREVTEESRHKNIGVVQQDIFLFVGSIAENIRCGRLDATREEVIKAMELAEIYADICNISDGFKTNWFTQGTDDTK